MTPQPVQIYGVPCVLAKSNGGGVDLQRHHEKRRGDRAADKPVPGRGQGRRSNPNGEGHNMKHAIARIFRRISADEVRTDQLHEAERLQVEHQAAGEMHSALAAVYRMRSERLRRELATAPVAQLRPVHSQET